MDQRIEVWIDDALDAQRELRLELEANDLRPLNRAQRRALASGGAKGLQDAQTLAANVERSRRTRAFKR